MEAKNYKEEGIMLIADSINDYEAAKGNSIKFYDYNLQFNIESHLAKFEKFQF